MTDDFKKLLGGQVKKIADSNQSDEFDRNANRVIRNARYATEQAQSDIAPVASDRIKSDDFIEFRRQGVQIGVVDKLATGEMRPNEIIDLHGMNLLEAEIYIRETISALDLPYMMCLKIIHGKGYNQKIESGEIHARMKNFVADYLVTHLRVLAYVSTPIEHGGAGALYVLIQKIT